MGRTGCEGCERVLGSRPLLLACLLGLIGCCLIHFCLHTELPDTLLQVLGKLARYAASRRPQSECLLRTVTMSSMTVGALLQYCNTSCIGDEVGMVGGLAGWDKTH